MIVKRTDLQAYPDVNNINYWKQERFVIYINVRPESYVALLNENSAEIARYTPAANGDVYIDITDYLRANAAPTATLTIHDDGIDEKYIMAVSVVGLINPFKVIIPRHAFSVALICPPSLMYCDGVNKLAAELFPDLPLWTIVGDAALRSDKRQIKDILGDFTLSISIGQNTERRTFSTTPLVCSVSYALVRWVSFTGVQRVHYFMLRNQTIASAENYQLLTLDNYYDEIKGRVDGLDLYLDDLLPYDLWYYADVITSSKVEVSLDGQTWNQVQVTNKNVTIPTWEKGNGKLEITVNWKRYDAVSM